MKLFQKIDNFQVTLVTGQVFDLYSTLKSGPVVVNFIMGTWCPFCTNHLKKVRLWQEKLGKKVTMIIISSESIETLRKWMKENPMSYLFASDPSLAIADQFNANHFMLKMATPSTFLIDSDHTLKLIFKGIRTDKKRKDMLDSICKTGNCEGNL
ncbi:MAG: hypothetical protein COW00_14150 [Bdellovibrio sp. CG12_big_fil_rev_8_21_14_0_65_39_13]|nr:MAG: hypothetical protein COW78_08105 [Bdellovibrio sp. CG22_combo_CG10-13_8_21_14_all_39_27]PIQ58755.1 MAG: hypothetical protein COW00_14150 [Bdellovibrio sp. CG12_big_fil_rev_8_21_14_0_65_39_13]PIR35564.1 MAG: hypothetical protein COV37_08810 [Bdellovibrio sp. CG11_big_fil_rev_8_21_14_0_20_39_38]PJB54404.1 MAG: hypothetical protein CO099_01755 [Bdellovibrio sp. CG_4_9_14_3_um_filter_39_7]